MQSLELVKTITAGSYLAGSSRSETTPELKVVLATRLTQYEQHLGRSETDRSSKSLEEVQLETACEALHVVSRVQSLINTPLNVSADEGAGAHNEYLIGTRDLSYIRTLLSIAVKWGIEPLLQRITSAIPNTTPIGPRRSGVQVIDLTTVPDDFKLFCTLVDELVAIPLPAGTSGPVASTHISVFVLDQYLSELFKAGITLGWLPKFQATDSVTPVDRLRPTIMHFLSILPATKVITALTTLLNDLSLLTYVRKTCSFLLGRQIMRPHGVKGLFLGIFGEEEEPNEEAPLDKLEQIARLLRTIPKGVPEEEYYRIIILQLVSILSSAEPNMPSAYRRAAAFTISSLLNSEPSTIPSHILLPLLHRPFIEPTSHLAEPSSHTNELNPTKALATIQALLINTDPSPTLISRLLTPIIPSLYTLYSTLEEHKMSEPALKVSVNGLLKTWGRLVGTDEGIASVWLIVEGEGGYWEVDITGEIIKTEQSEDQLHEFSLFTPVDLQKAEESGELDADANILHLKPDPVYFVRYLKSIDRSDITGDIFVKLLEAYQQSKLGSNQDPMRTVLYLQIVMQIQSQLASDNASTNILKKPDHILAFIKHALETATQPTNTPKPSLSKQASSSLRIEDLRIIDGEVIPNVDDGDSDDEGDGSEDDGGDDMTTTAVNLLLSVLEANADLSIQTTPILDDVFDLLDKLVKTGAENVKPLAREARMVLTARLASSSTSSTLTKSKRTASEESAQETYQKALKLLQDPLLPVRAHGLLLLRQLVSSRSTPGGKLESPSVDKALVPGILSIFLQSLQDDDSYIFLNAVQGLSAMVDGFGKDTLKGLVDLYAQGSEGVASTSFTKYDVDQRTRIGEALVQVIRRCANALPIYGDILVPPLYRVIRTSHLPTALRTSALSLLAQCSSTNTLVVLPYTNELLSAMVDLLQVESVALRPSELREVEGKEKQQERTTMESQPTTTNSKLPPLRRAAVYLASLLLKSYAEQMIEDHSRMPYILPPSTLDRTKHTASYIAATDEDSVVRVMAKELVDTIQELYQITIGI